MEPDPGVEGEAVSEPQLELELELVRRGARKVDGHWLVASGQLSCVWSGNHSKNNSV